MSTAVKDLYDIGETPPLGHVPPKMHASVIRRERFGPPKDAFQIEVVSTCPEIGPREALVYVMAAGINYNNVWAALGMPVDVIKVHAQKGDDTGFHIGGSDASGIVYAVGDEVTNVKVGDEVVVHCGAWDPEADDVKAADDPMFAPSFKIWGYETNWGSFAQFTKVWAHQCMPKAKHLTWEAAAAPTARRRDRVPHAHGLDAAHRARGRRRAGVGRRRRPGHDGDPDREGDGRASRSPSSRATPRASTARSSAPTGYMNRKEFDALGPHARLDRRRRLQRVAAGRARVRQGVLGGARRAQEPAHRVRAPRRGHRADVDLHGARTAAWS